MKVVIQRVAMASVIVVETQQIAGKIGPGLFCLVGIKRGDTEGEVRSMAQKIVKLRIFEETPGKMTVSAIDKSLPILLVSQFTLLANTKGGNRPSFLDAEEPTRARELYDLLCDEVGKAVPVQKGSFGKLMSISAELDGPVTIVLD